MSVHVMPDGDYQIIHPYIPLNGSIPLKYEFSYEFGTYLTNILKNKPEGNAPWEARSYKIARRKSTYGVLMTELHYLTELGETVAKDIDRSMEQLIDGYTVNFQDLPDAGQISELPVIRDESDNSSLSNYYPEHVGLEVIVPFGRIPERGIRILRDAYLLQTVGVKAHELEQSADFEKTLVNDLKNLRQDLPPHVRHSRFLDPVDLFRAEVSESIRYLDSRYVHPVRMKRIYRNRVAFEKLIMFGLLEVFNLPRTAIQKGRGRPPVALKLTSVGVKFVELWVSRFDVTQPAVMPIQ